MRPNTAGDNVASESGIKAALAKNFAKKMLNPKKMQDDVKSSVTEIRNKFLIQLAKVYETSTQKEGVVGCNRII